MLVKIKNKLKKRPILFKLLKPIKVFLVDKPAEKLRNHRFKIHGKEALLTFDMAAKEANIEYWLAFGTLLGAVREKGFIKHDLDIDVGMLLSNYSNKHEGIFNKYGFKKTRQFLIDDGKYGREETYTYKNVDIDIFYYKKKQNTITCHLFSKSDEYGSFDYSLPKNEYIIREISYPVSNLSQISFLTSTFNIPSNYHEVLSLDYGNNYLIPDPNYKAGARVNVNYLRNLRGHITINLK